MRHALISLSDKRGLEPLATALATAGFRLLSTGGTADVLRDAGHEVTDVAELTGFPEIMDGRVKTLHPKIHGALLGRAGVDDDVMAEHDIPAIDLLVLNLYPFEDTVARSGVTLEQAIEQVDIGGPAMLRAGAKNFERVAVVTDPGQYPALVGELEATGTLSRDTRFRLAVAAFDLVARYDAAISEYLSSLKDDGSRATFPGQANAHFLKLGDLRYGENPHQEAAWYRDPDPAPGSLVTLSQRQGKALSYNNIADADAAWSCVRQFSAASCVIVKHANPCGVASHADLSEAYARAFACDRTSAFGGIIAFNRALDSSTAQDIIDNQFVEVLIAPSVSAGALEVLAAKPNVRVLEIPLVEGTPEVRGHDLRRISGGLLLQTADDRQVSRDDCRVVTQRAPDDHEWDDALFAWRVARAVRSNAIVYAADQRTLGIGAGQMSRVDSARIGRWKADDAGLSLDGAAMASDAFFPFRDSIDTAAGAGIRCIIQPGGSMRDEEVIAAANERGMAMIFTGIRHFRH